MGSKGAGSRGYSCWYKAGQPGLEANSSAVDVASSMTEQAEDVTKKQMTDDSTVATPSLGTCFANERVDCGFVGISSNQCTGYGCCYRKLNEGLSCTLPQECTLTMHNARD